MNSTRATSAAGATVIARRRSLLSAEILKVTSTKMWLGMLIGVALYIGIGVVATIFAPEQQKACAICSPPRGADTSSRS